MVLFQHKSWPHLQGVDLHRLWGGLANTRGDGGGRRGHLLAEAVIVPSHRLSLLPMLSVTDVGILITKPTHVGLRMMLSNLSRLSMQ